MINRISTPLLAPNINNRFIHVQYLAGSILILLGLLSAIAWQLQLDRLIYQSFVLMHFNSALGFVFSGVAIISMAKNRSWIAVLIGIFISVLAAMSLYENMTGHNLAMDDLLSRARDEQYPVQMPLNTALALLFAGVSLAVAGRQTNQQKLFIVISILGAGVISLGLAALVGYATGMETLHTWPSNTPGGMSIPTAFACILLGLILIARGVPIDQTLDWSIWLTVLPGLVAAFMLLLWDGLQRHAQDNLRSEIEQQASLLAHTIDTAFRYRLSALERMALHWERGGSISQPLWETDAMDYYHDLPGFQAIEYADADGRIRWVVPKTGNEQAINLDLNSEPVRREALQEARAGRGIVISEPIDLVQGGKGFLAIRGLRSGDRITGYLLGVFRINIIFTILTPTAKNISWTIYKDNKPVLHHEEKLGTATLSAMRALDFAP